MYLDLNYRLYLVRSLFFRRASQNVVSLGRRPAAPLRVIVSAHLDAGRTGAIHAPARAARAARIARRVPCRSARFGSCSGRWPRCCRCSALRMAGVDSGAISVAAAPPHARPPGRRSSPWSRSSSRRSSPAPTTTRPGSRRRSRSRASSKPRHRRTSTSGSCSTAPRSAGQEGMRAFVRRHRKRLERDSTVFIDLDSVGRRRRSASRPAPAGWSSYPADRRLIELCEAIAEADAEGDRRFRAKPLRRGSAGDAVPPRLAGFAVDRDHLSRLRRPDPRPPPADRQPGAIRPEALERAHGFALELIRALDRDVGPLRRGGARRGDRRVNESPVKLWEPSAEAIERSNLTAYMRWLADERGLAFEGDYDALWRWSIDSLEEFWATIWEHFDVRASAALRAGAREPRDAGRAVVHRRAAQLRREPARRQARRPARDPARLRAARARLAHLGRAARARSLASRRDCARSGSSRATASSPTCRTFPRP